MSEEQDGPAGPVYGPRRRAPMYYAGETYGRRPIQYPDVERDARGRVSGIRDKAARRIIRAALKRKFSKVERGLALSRAMLAQAREIARGEKKGSRWARKLFAKELAIHQSVYAPDHKQLRAIRTEKRKLKREGKKDAIAQLVDRMTK